MPQVPEALANFVCTPLTEFKNLQYIIAEHEIRKMELITGLESKERLDYELKKSIEQEDYEKAAEIRNKMKVR